MRTLSTALSTALGGPVQRPAFLVEAGFATVRRWSSMGSVTWGGYTWAPQSMRLDGLQVQALEVRGTLVLENADGAASTLVLGDGVQDRTFRLWGFDAAATGSLDVVWLADAVGGAAEIAPSTGEVRISLRHPAEFVTSPRTFVGPQSGFMQLLPAGTVLRINGQAYTLERP